MRDELSDWIAEHQCTYEIQPIVELAAGEVAQMGFELSLHAELPIRGPITPEDGKKLDGIRDKLGEILKTPLTRGVESSFRARPLSPRGAIYGRQEPEGDAHRPRLPPRLSKGPAGRPGEVRAH